MSFSLISSAIYLRKLIFCFFSFMATRTGSIFLYLKQYMYQPKRFGHFWVIRLQTDRQTNKHPNTLNKGISVFFYIFGSCSSKLYIIWISMYPPIILQARKANITRWILLNNFEIVNYRGWLGIGCLFTWHDVLLQIEGKGKDAYLYKFNKIYLVI